MGILSSDPMTLHVGDVYNITYKGYGFGNARNFRFYKQDVETVITKFKNLTKIDKGMIELFITPQFEAPRFNVKIITLASPNTDEYAPHGWTIKIWETAEGYEYRAKVENFIPRFDQFEDHKDRPLYVIEIIKKSHGCTNDK